VGIVDNSLNVHLSDACHPDRLPDIWMVRSLTSCDAGALLPIQSGAPRGAVEWSAGDFVSALACPWSERVGYLCLGLCVGIPQDSGVLSSNVGGHDGESHLEHKLGGFIIVHVVDDEADVQHLAVDTPLNGRGAGRALLQEALIRLALREVTSVFLEVRASNYRALNLYKRVGFIKVGVRPGYYVDTGEDALVMNYVL